MSACGDIRAPLQWMRLRLLLPAFMFSEIPHFPRHHQVVAPGERGGKEMPGKYSRWRKYGHMAYFSVEYHFTLRRLESVSWPDGSQQPGPGEQLREE